MSGEDVGGFVSNLDALFEIVEQKEADPEE